MQKSVAIIGGGPAGLMAAEVLSQGGARVEVFDAMPSLGRKLLMAGKSGLNMTHSEPHEKLVGRYGARESELRPYLDRFNGEALRAWARELGSETFVGTSGRVFPVAMKASPLLRAWLKRLQDGGVTWHRRHQWLGWREGSLAFATPAGEVHARPDATVLALGGASWPKLGSRGEWVEWLRRAGVQIAPFRPANCGFSVAWSPHFRDRFPGQPLKSVALSVGRFQQQGEFVVTQTGVEGSLIYAAAATLRDLLDATGSAAITLDLLPDWSANKVLTALERPRGSRSLSNHLEKTVGIRGVKAGLVYEFVPREILAQPVRLAAALKALVVPLASANSLETAISSAGGIDFAELDSRLMLKKLPGVFCAGEMLDWEAPTGGYLLTACFATGRAAGAGALEWFRQG